MDQREKTLLSVNCYRMKQYRKSNEIFLIKIFIRRKEKKGSVSLKKKYFIVRFIYWHVLIVVVHVVPKGQAQEFAVVLPQTIFPGQIQCPK